MCIVAYSANHASCAFYSNNTLLHILYISSLSNSFYFSISAEERLRTDEYQSSVMMEAAGTDEESSKPVMTDEDITNISSVTKASGDHLGDDDDGEDEEGDNDEEGMRSAYSVTDLLDELDSGSDDQVGVADGNDDDDDVAKETAANHDSSCAQAADGEEPASAVDQDEPTKKPNGQDTTPEPCPAKECRINKDVPPTLDRSVRNTLQRLPDTLDREVPMSDSVKTSDAELSPEHDYEPISGASQGGTLIQQCEYFGFC